MRWRQVAFVVVLTGFHIVSWGNPKSQLVYARPGWSSRRKLDARENTRDLWNHGFDNYMMYAFPLDELMPLSCTGRGPDWENPNNYGNNDVAGNFSLTLIDVLDTFVVLDDQVGFEKAVRNVIGWVSFDVNTKPQVFETTIRVLGGLLSGHIFASDSKGRFFLPWYRGELLILAHDLGNRLLPAFATPTGIPYARLNLRHGVPYGESLETCTAGAGSLILEFGTLSRLTGDDRFEKAAYKAFFALWNRKSDLGLVGNTINTWTGKWMLPEVTGIGAGVDSFYEYALKWYVLSGEVEFLDVWHEAYAAIMRYSRGTDGFWFRPVNIHSGAAAFNTVDSLSAFWSGLQILAGDTENAIKSHLIFWNLWKRNSGLPEVWDINYMQAVATQYPLRPEFVESTYYLYRATGDSFYLDVGERILKDLIVRAKVECGLAGIADLKANKRDDRMESFVLSETLKYLFLLFDEANPLHRDDSNFVFTTEGHILTLGSIHLKPLSPVRRKLRRVENLQCPEYRPIRVGTDDLRDENSGLVTGIRYRPDVDYARALAGAASLEFDEDWWSPYGRCDIPSADLYSYDFILSVNGKLVPEDASPSLKKLYEVQDGFMLQNISGIRTHIVSRLDGKGYDIVKLGPYAVRSGQMVYVNDTDLTLAPAITQGTIDDDGFPVTRDRDIQLRFALETIDPILQNQPGAQASDIAVTAMAYTSTFGGDPTSSHRSKQEPLSFARGNANRLTLASANPLGCQAYAPNAFRTESVVLVRRGECTFLEKLMHAAKAGAAGVVVISDDDFPLNPSAEQDEIIAQGDYLDRVALVVITRTAGAEVLKLMGSAEAHGFSDVMVFVEPEGQSGVTETYATEQRRHNGANKDKASNPSDDPRGKILYLNGHPLLNTRLLV